MWCTNDAERPVSGPTIVSNGSVSVKAADVLAEVCAHVRDETYCNMPHILKHLTGHRRPSKTSISSGRDTGVQERSSDTKWAQMKSSSLCGASCNSGTHHPFHDDDCTVIRGIRKAHCAFPPSPSLRTQQMAVTVAMKRMTCHLTTASHASSRSTSRQTTARSTLTTQAACKHWGGCSMYLPVCFAVREDERVLQALSTDV